MKMVSLNRVSYIITEHKLVIAYTVTFILSLVIFYYYIFYNPHVFYSRGSDASYYISIAKNLFAGGGFYDASTIPNGPIVTPQNGIVFIELLLLKSGIQDVNYLYSSMASINYLALLVSSILLYRISRLGGVSSWITFLIVANFLLSINISAAVINPTNDGIAFLLSLGGVILCMQNHKKNNHWRYMFFLLISVVAVHFRLQYVLIPLSAAFVSMLDKQYKAFVSYSMVAIASLALVYIPYKYLIESRGEIQSNFNHVLNNINFDSFIDVVRGIQVLILKFGEGAGSGLVNQLMPIFIIFTVLLVLICIIFLFKGDFRSALISSVILSTMVLFFITLAPSFRYILIVSPLLMLLLAYNLKWEKFAVIILFTYLLYGLLIFVVKVGVIEKGFIEQKKQTEIVSYLFENEITFISESPRTSYMLFNKSSSSKVFLSKGQNEIVIFGSKEFILRETKKIDSEFRLVKTNNYGSHWSVGASKFELIKLTVMF
ncbi:hypothetical protein N8157_01165 [Burkholderiales bacterium]|nr:hypothetical protein [Burkholderiales bacterium]